MLFRTPDSLIFKFVINTWLLNRHQSIGVMREDWHHFADVSYRIPASYWY